MIINNLGVIMAGEAVPDVDLSVNKKVVVGPGLRQRGDRVYACKTGSLCKKEPKTYWVDNHQKRYVPVKGELVMGAVTAKAGDFFRVDIGSSEPAMLSYLAFENATKKNRPNVKIGDVLYARLLVADKDTEPELVCVDSHGKAGKLGIIEDGFVFACGLHLVRRILTKRCPVLELMAKEIPFEIAVGLNGRIWIKANSTKETIAVGNALLATEYASDDEINKMCQNIGALLAHYF